MNTWKWKRMLSQEFKFHRDDLVEVSLRVTDNLLKNLFFDLPLPFSIVSLIPIEFFGFDNFCSIGDIDFYWGISPHVSCFFYLVFSKIVIDERCECIVEIEWIGRWRKEFPKTSVLFHRSKDLIGKLMPFLFSVLFIQDAKLFIFESDTTDTKRTTLEKISIVDIRTLVDLCRTIELRRITSGTNTSKEIMRICPTINTVIICFMNPFSTTTKKEISRIVNIHKPSRVFNVSALYKIGTSHICRSEIFSSLFMHFLIPSFKSLFFLEDSLFFEHILLLGIHRILNAVFLIL